MSITAIGAALAAFNSAKNIAQSMISLHDTAAFQAKTIEFQGAILDAQSAIFAANEERTALVQQVRELEEKVAKLETWEAQKQRYELKELPPGVFVYALKPAMANGEPAHNICQTCYQRGKKSILHVIPQMNGISTVLCHECGTAVSVGIFQADAEARRKW